MQASINQLKLALEVCEVNEPINRDAGKLEQAELEAVNAADFRQAIAVLEAASNGPIWPELKGDYEFGVDPEFLSETVNY
jgi:hypothetical protein